MFSCFGIVCMDKVKYQTLVWFFQFQNFMKYNYKASFCLRFQDQDKEAFLQEQLSFKIRNSETLVTQTHHFSSCNNKKEFTPSHDISVSMNDSIFPQLFRLAIDELALISFPFPPHSNSCQIPSTPFPYYILQLLLSFISLLPLIWIRSSSNRGAKGKMIVLLANI